jgi:hypothetical protein
MTPKRFQDTEGVSFPFTVFDDRAGREGRRGSGMYAMVAEGEHTRTLPPKVYASVKSKVDDGEGQFGANDFRGAFATFNEALNLLPEPRQQWNAAGWLLVAMGECAVRLGSWKAAVGPFQNAMICPGTLGNPWAHLRLGQVRLELGEDQRAADELARAYMGGGREVFQGQDPKYFALVERVLKPPQGMDRLP